MTTKTIPCTSFSSKIILREHGQGPIKLSRADLLADIFRIDRPVTGYSDNTIQRFNSSIVVEMSDEIGAQVETRLGVIALAIHRHHMNWLVRFTWTMVEAGSEAKQAIRQFYRMYQLDEDDLSEDTAYRQYERFRKEFFEKKPEKSGTLPGRDVRQKCRLLRRGEGRKITLSETELDLLCERFSSRLRDAMPKMPKYVHLQAHIFIYKHLGERKVKVLEKKFERSRRRVFAALTRIDDYIRYYEGFREVIVPYLEPDSVLYQPEPAAHL